MRLSKWNTDEIIAYWIEKILFLVFYPIILILNIRKVHFSSIFNTPIPRRLQETFEIKLRAEFGNSCIFIDLQIRKLLIILPIMAF